MATLSESESRRLYSWWWDSHISPKNSKWLQENLTDMDSKIKAMIKLIEEDADSFARRAEMYYKKRPELMKLVEEFYRAYRALAERYDYITGELRHAHRTMAEAFPNHQPPFSMPDDSPTVRRPHTPDPEADVSKKTLEKLRELFGSGENPDFFPGKENLDSGEVEKLKKALNDAETEKEAVRVRYQERVEKLCNVEEELNRAKTDCFKLKVQASEAENEISTLKEALSKLEAEKEVGFLNLEKKIAVTEEEARLLKNRADTAETEVKKLEESLKKLKEEKEDCLEKISELEKEIFSARDELKRLQNEMLMGKSKLKSVEEKCVVLEISNRSLRLEAENLIKKIAFKDQELAEKHSELERFNIQVQEERSRYVQVEENLRNLENLQSRSTDELRNGLRLLKEMEISKHGLEEELHRVKDENWSLNESNSSSSISIRNLESEIVSLRKMKEKLKEELAVQFQEIFRLKEEIKSLNTSYNDLMEQVKSLGLNPDSFGSSVKDLQEENLKLKRTCEHERDEKEVIFKKIEDMEEKFGGTLVQEKAVLLSQLQVITNNMQSLLERNNFLEDSLSGAKIEITALREKSKKLEELSRVLDDEKLNLVKERSGLVIQLENVEQRLGNLEEKFAEFEGKYMGLEKEKESTQSQVEELKVCLGAEKEERESLTLWSETRLASLQNHVDVLEEESRWRQIEFQEELDKVVISEFEIFILQKFIQEMEEKNSSVLTEFQKLVEESKFSEKLIEELEIENLEQQVESELLLVEIEKLRLIIYQVFKALDTCANIGSEEKIGKKEESLVHFILGDIEKTKRSLTKYEEDLEKLLVEKSVILTVLGQMQNENEEVVEMNGLLRTEIRRRDQWSRLLEAEAESLRLKQGDVQKAYVELEEENRSLLGKFVELMEEKRLLEEETDAITLETFSLGTISTFFKSFATENAFELKLLWEDLQNTRSVKNTIETENLFLKDSIHRLEIELFRVNDFNIGLCKTVEGLKREYEESKLMRENSELQIIKQQKEIQFLREEIEERRMREEKLTMELRERTNEFEIWEAEAEKFYFDLQNSVFREVLFEDKAKELALVCERLEDESFSKARDIEVVKGRVDLKESEIGGLKAQLHAYAPFVVSMRENLASLQHNTLSLTKLIAADNRKSKDKETAADLHEESHQEVMEEHNCPLPSGILELKHLQQQIKEVEKVVVEQKKRLAMREIKEMKSNCSPVRVKVDQNEETVLWDKPALDDLKLRRVKSKKLEPKNGVLMKDIPLDEICTRRSSKADYQTRESTENDTAYHQSLELQIEKELRVDNLQVQESAKKGKILQRLASNSQRLSSLQTNIQELKTKLAVNKKGKRGKGLDFDKLEEQLREVEAIVAQMTGLNGLLKKDTEESRSSSDEDSSRIYEEAQTGFERIVRLQLEVEKIGCMMTKMEVDKKSKWKISLSRMKSRSKIVVRSLIYIGRMRRSSSGRRKKGCFSGCFRSSRNGELNHM